MCKKSCSLLLLVILLNVVSCSKPQEEIIVPNTLTTELNKQATFEDKVGLQKEIIKHQESEMERQKRELQDLERQRMYNDSLKRFEKTGN